MSIDGCSSSFAVQLSTSCRSAREAARANRRSSSPRTDARASATPSGEGSRAPDRAAAAARASSPACRSVPRGRRLGHTPSCRPATTTTSKDAADERRRRGDDHGLGAALRGERVFGQLAREHFVDEAHGRRVGLALDMALRRGEQRDRGVERPVRLVGEHAGAARLRRPTRSARPLPSHSAQSTSSIEPPPTRRRRARCRAPSRSRAARRAGAASIVSKPPGAASASTSSSSPVRLPPPASSSWRRARRSRRRPTPSSRPMGPVSNATASSA